MSKFTSNKLEIQELSIKDPSLDSLYSIDRRRTLNNLRNKINKILHKVIPFEDMNVERIRNDVYYEEEEKPSFFIVFFFVILTFWCGFICQALAFIFAILGYMSATSGDIKNAYFLRRAAICFLILGLIFTILLVVPLSQSYKPPFEVSDNAFYLKTCDPGCFLQEIYDSCFC